MEKRWDRREAHMQAARLAQTCGDHPKVMELYGLYRALERAYVEALERTLVAEDKLERLWGALMEVDGDGAYEQTAAVGDIRAGQDGGA